MRDEEEDERVDPQCFLFLSVSFSNQITQINTVIKRVRNRHSLSHSMCYPPVAQQHEDLRGEFVGKNDEVLKEESNAKTRLSIPELFHVQEMLTSDA